MQGGKAAAETILQLRQAGDFSKANTRLFERRWMQLFGHDFKLVGPCLLCLLRMFLKLSHHHGWPGRTSDAGS